MAFVKPLAVTTHAAHQADELQGEQVFIPGAGSIGCLVISAIKTLGIAEIVCADASPRFLSLGREMGVDMLVDPQNDDMDHWKAEKDYFNVSFEVSGHPSSVNTCLEITHIRSVMVQVGIGDAVAKFPMMTLIGEEISLKGSFHFTSELNTTVSWLTSGVINPLPLLSTEYPFTDLGEALRFVGDRAQAAEVQLVF